MMDSENQLEQGRPRVDERRPKEPSMTQNRRQRGVWLFRSTILLAIAFHGIAGVAGAIDIDIKETRWGFNGKVALNRFNLLSVLVDNPSPQNFVGKIRLQKSLGDARIVEEVSIAPFSSRWVQFYPYVNNSWNNTASNENWTLIYAGGKAYDVPQPRVAKYQRVVLDDSTGISPRGGVLKPMPENLFPAFVSATDALQVVGMDREPRTWIPAQKEAFLDWVSLGGTVLLLHGPTGKFPEFAGTLSALNSPLDDRRYGAGRILKVGMQRSQFNEDEARQVLISLPKNRLQNNEKPEDLIDVVDPNTQVQVNPIDPYSDGSDPFVSSSFLGQLKDMTKPEHNWLLLHFMFWVYIGMVFPGCYLLGKRWSDFRIVYAGLLGTVTLFSILFSIVGQRGYGEATAVHTVAIARSMPDGGMDVAAWSNVFVTSGADYVIKHNGRGALYSTCSETERVNGDIDNGTDGAFLVDIPPFSNREFAMRIRLPEGAPKVTLDHIKLSGDHIEELSLDVEGISYTDSINAYVLHGDRFYSMHWQGQSLKLSSDAGNVASVLRVPSMQNWNTNGNAYNYGYNNQEISVQQRFSTMFTPLLSRSLNVSKDSDAQQARLPPGILRLYVYAKMPPVFAIQNERLGAQEGQVLYSIDVHIE
jgi:hypothetical protein